MLRIAIQVKELVSSNVTSMVEAASDPLKLLHRLQREIEEAIIALEGDRTRADQRQRRLTAQIEQARAHEAEWGDKARIAMDHDREDLARQALLAREDARAALAGLEADHASLADELAEILATIAQLEAKRAETRARAKEHRAAAAAAPVSGPAAGTGTGTGTGTAASRAERHRNRIEELARRTDFATEDTAQDRAHTALDQEIAALRRERAIEAELAAMKGAQAKPPAAKKANATPKAAPKRASSKKRA